jgi:hypothetical protein
MYPNPRDVTSYPLSASRISICPGILYYVSFSCGKKVGAPELGCETTFNNHEATSSHDPPRMICYDLLWVHGAQT